MEASEAQGILEDPVNVLVVQAMEVDKLTYPEATERLGIGREAIRRRRAQVALAARHVMDDEIMVAEVDAARVIQINRIEDAYQTALQTWAKAIEGKENRGYTPNTDDAYNLAKIVEKFEKILTPILGTERPKKIEIDGLARTPLDVELEIVLSEG